MLRILPDELPPIPLDDAELPGAVAIARPMDVVAKARWNDYRATHGPIESAAVAVRPQILRVEGLTVQAAPGAPPVPFDPTDDRHWAAFPVAAIDRIFGAIFQRTVLTEDAEKNSASPSASDGMSGTDA